MHFAFKQSHQRSGPARRRLAHAAAGAAAIVLPLVCTSAWAVVKPAVDQEAAGLPSGMESLTDKEMAAVNGQALFVNDKIAPADDGDGSEPNDFTFHRMGLDAELGLNANIDKLQLGCGGFNNAIPGASGACDIDMDFVRFMGRDGTSAGEPLSDFVLKRPYVEMAVRDDDSPTQREIAGIKIGAEEADGYVSVGRDYLDPDGSPSGNTINKENGPQGFDDNGDPIGCSSAQGPGAVACHSGINRISGNIRAELSGRLQVTITFGFLDSTSDACFGNTNFSNGYKACNDRDPFFKSIQGTRLDTIEVPNLVLEIDGGLAGSLASEAYAQAVVNTRMIHNFALENTQDFFLSFQREEIAYPTFSGNSYSETANAGWWMNIPSVKILDLDAPEQTISIGQGLDALAPPGLRLTNVEFGQTPADNCRGAPVFC